MEDIIYCGNGIRPLGPRGPLGIILLPGAIIALRERGRVL